MNTFHKTPFKILGGHGVEEKDIEALERTFGKRFPGDVGGPDAAVVWLLSVLPWDATYAIVAEWLVDAFKRGEINDDPRTGRVLRLLASKNVVDADRLGYELDGLIETLARVKGIPMEFDDETDDPTTALKNVTDDFRAWCAARSAIEAVKHTARPSAEEGESCAYAVFAVFRWVISQEIPVSRTVRMDRLLQALAAATAQFVGGWAKGAKA